MKLILAFSLSLYLICGHAVAQTTVKVSIPDVKFDPITFTDFIKQVGENNALIRAKKFALDSSVAQQGPAGLSNVNPSFTYSRGAYYGQVPYTPYVSPGSNTYSLSGTLEGWGKRTARKDFAASEVGRNSAELDSLASAVRADAAFSFLDTLRFKLLWLSFQKAIADSQKIGDQGLANDLKENQSNFGNDIRYFALNMGTFLARPTNDLLEPVGDLDNVKPKTFNLQELISNAHSNRKDIIALTESIKASSAFLELTKKNRNIDINPSVWYSMTPPYVSSSTQYGATTAFGFSVSVPIPVQLVYDADVVQAGNQKLTQEAYLNDLKARVAAEVSQAFLQYGFAKKRLESEQENFGQLTKNSGKLNSKTIISLRDGEGELIDAKINHAKALFFLLRVSGNYDFPNF